MSIPDWIPIQWRIQRPQNIIFRVDGGRVKGLSFGHLARCTTIAKWLRAHWKTQCQFISRNIPEGVRFIRELDFPVVEIERDELEVVSTFILEKRPAIDWLVIDLPYENAPLVEMSRTAIQSSIKTALIDDFRFAAPKHTHIYHNSSILAQTNTLLVPQQCELCIGPKYFVMEYPAGELKKNIPLLVTMGGSDPTNLTEPIARLLTKETIQATVVTGPGYQAPHEIQGLCSESSLTHIHNPSSLVALIAQSRHVICAGGRTLTEALILNTVPIPVASIGHERETIRALAERNYLEHYLLELNSEKLTKVLRQLFPDDI
jgi:spore coat polysaccharide biosynthesis predicted glycosyltransferase SpsG